MTGDIVFRLGD